MLIPLVMLDADDTEGFTASSQQILMHIVWMYQNSILKGISCEYTERETPISACGNGTGTDTELGIALFRFNLFFWEKKKLLLI